MTMFTKSTLALALGIAAGVKAQCVGAPVNQATISLIAEFEGFVPDIYIDPTGNPTVGYGHLCGDPYCSEVPYPIPLSEADGQELLRGDVASFQDCITLITAESVVLNDNQYGALVSWSYNNGCGAAEGSTLIARLNAGEDPNTVAAEELPQWVYGDGEVLPGLVRRREAEVNLHLTPSDIGVLPNPNC